MMAVLAIVCLLETGLGYRIDGLRRCESAREIGAICDCWVPQSMDASEGAVIYDSERSSNRGEKGTISEYFFVKSG